MANEEATLPAGTSLHSEPKAEARRAGGLSQARYVLRSMRPRQWTKNGIVLLALVFSVGQEYHLSEPSTWLPKALEALVAFACFTFVSSAEYLVNDIADVESDRAHPRKSRRPIAAGLLPVKTA